MKETNEKQGTWDGDFGINYTIRNKIIPEHMVPFYKKVFKDLKVKRILEAGCNRGHNLMAMTYCGEYELYGFDINPYSVLLARENKEISFTTGNIFDILYKDKYFDLVFTSGVLIHIDPKKLEDAIRELLRVSSQYLMILEYNYEFDEFEKVPYREQVGFWRGNFKKFILDHFDVKLISGGTVGLADGFLSERQYFIFEKNNPSS